MAFQAMRLYVLIAPRKKSTQAFAGLETAPGKYYIE